MSARTLLRDDQDPASGEIERAPGSRWSRSEVVWAGTLTLVVAIAGAWQLSRASLWNDEAATWAISGHSFGDLFKVFRTSGGDRGAALYYAVEFGWMRVFGTSEAAMRSLSLVAAAATMVPFHAVARRLVDRPAAWASGAILATSPFFLAYAREARTYALAVLLVVLTVWTFLRAVESDARRDWWIFSGLAVLAVYTHWFSALVVFALFLALWRRPDIGNRRRAATSAVMLATAFVPIAILVLTGSDSGVDWIAKLNLDELRTLASGFTGADGTAIQLVFLAVLTTGFVAAWNERHRWRTPPVVLTWFLLPVGLTVLISLVKPLLVTRYLIIALPGFALLLGLGLSRIVRGRVPALAAAVLILAILGAHGYDAVWTASKGKEDWRAIVSAVGAHARPEDAIVVFPATAVSAFSYYARDSAAFAGRAGPSWPPLHWDAPFDRLIANATVLHTPALDHSPVVWLVIRAPHGNTVTRSVRNSSVLADLRARLEQRFATAVEIAPWTEHDTVFVIRYARPVGR